MNGLSFVGFMYCIYVHMDKCVSVMPCVAFDVDTVNSSTNLNQKRSCQAFIVWLIPQFDVETVYFKLMSAILCRICSV